MTTIANSIWLATALLHWQNPRAADFSVGEIVRKAIAENLVEGFRPGLQVFASKHCVANKSPNPGRYRMLLETTRGRRRLFRNGDPFDAGRKQGKIRPDKQDVPPAYQRLIDWYEAQYVKQVSQSEPEPQGQNSGPSFSTPSMEQQPSIAFIGPAGSVVIPDNLRKELGIEEGSRLSIRRDNDRIVLQPVSEELITRLRGSCKGGELLVEAREREHRDERY
jgi:AbrB family looped-hinge helix DNA binding protein